MPIEVPIEMLLGLGGWGGWEGGEAIIFRRDDRIFRLEDTLFFASLHRRSTLAKISKIYKNTHMFQEINLFIFVWHPESRKQTSWR